MDKREYIQHWNYFCSLAERLDSTKYYVDHGLTVDDDKIELVHKDVYSDVFKQIFRDLSIAYSFLVGYFRCKYTAQPTNSGEGCLPDYGNMSPIEK